MGAVVGGSGPRYISRECLAAEFRAQALQIQVEHLSSELTRLKATVREHLTALPSDRAQTLARLRWLLRHTSSDASA